MDAEPVLGSLDTSPQEEQESRKPKWGWTPFPPTLAFFFPGSLPSAVGGGAYPSLRCVRQYPAGGGSTDWYLAADHRKEAGSMPAFQVVLPLSPSNAFRHGNPENPRSWEGRTLVMSWISGCQSSPTQSHSCIQTQSLAKCTCFRLIVLRVKVLGWTRFCIPCLLRLLCLPCLLFLSCLPSLADGHVAQCG